MPRPSRRYFTQTELKDLFSVSSEGLRTSSTQQQLDGLHRHQRNATQQMEAHLAEVMRMEGVAGEARGRHQQA